MRDKLAVSVGECLVYEIICRYDAIKILITDRGTEFLIEVMRELKLIFFSVKIKSTALFKIKKISNTYYNPGSDGLAENHMNIKGSVVIIC